MLLTLWLENTWLDSSGFRRKLYSEKHVRKAVWLRFSLSVGTKSLGRKYAEYLCVGVLLPMRRFGGGLQGICWNISIKGGPNKCPVDVENV